MPKLPSAEDLGRRTPTARSGIVSMSTAASERIARSAGERTQIQSQAIDEFQRINEKRAEERAKMDALKAESYVLQATTELEDEIRRNPEWEKNQEIYNQRAEEIRKQALTLIPQDKHEIFSLGFDKIKANGIGEVNKITYDKEREHYRAEEVVNYDRTQQGLAAALAEGDEGRAAIILQNHLAVIAENERNGAWATDVAAGRAVDAKNTLIYDAIESLSPEQAGQYVLPSDGAEPSKANAQTIIPSVISQSEGGFVASDGASGAPAIYGINRKYHEAAYDEAEKITIEQGEAAGKAYADQFYKTEYWDRYNLDQFSAPVSRVLFDGVINHHSKFNDKLVQAAKSGASPQELIQMRRKEYDRLGAKPQYAPSHSGWMNRLSKLSQVVDAESTPVSGGIASLLPPDRLATLRESVNKKVEAQKVKKAVQNLSFANTEQERTILSQHADSPAVIKAYEKKKKDLSEDPAGYVTNHPDVIQARQQVEKVLSDPSISEDQKELFSSAYYDSIRKAQTDMGLAPHQTRIVPKQESLGVIEVLQNPNLSEDQILQTVDPFLQTYRGEGVLSLRDNGLEGPTFALVNMRAGNDRDELVRAIKDGSGTLEKVIGNDAVKEIRKTAFSELEDYREAVGKTRMPDSAAIAADSLAATELLAMKYASQGVNPSKAAKKAAQNVVYGNFKAVDGVLVAPEADDQVVREFLGDKQALLGQFDIYVPPQAANAPDQYRSNLYRDAEIVAVGENFYFYGPDGQPLIDANIAEFDENGRVTNPEIAAIKIPVAEGLSRTKAAIEDEVTVTAAQIQKTTGDNIRNKFRPYAIITQGDRKVQMPYFYVGGQGWRGSHIFSEEDYQRAEPEQKKLIRERLQQAVDYTKAYRETLSADEKSKFDRLYQINKQAREQVKTGERKQNIQTLRTLISPAMILEVPKWAK